MSKKKVVLLDNYDSFTFNLYGKGTAVNVPNSVTNVTSSVFFLSDKNFQLFLIQNRYLFAVGFNQSVVLHVRNFPCQ